MDTFLLLGVVEEDLDGLLDERVVRGRGWLEAGDGRDEGEGSLVVLCTASDPKQLSGSAYKERQRKGRAHSL